MDNTTAIIQVKHIKKYYGKEPTIVKALDDVSLDIEKGSLALLLEQVEVVNQHYYI